MEKFCNFYLSQENWKLSRNIWFWCPLVLHKTFAFASLALKPTVWVLQQKQFLLFTNFYTIFTNRIKFKFWQFQDKPAQKNHGNHADGTVAEESRQLWLCVSFNQSFDIDWNPQTGRASKCLLRRTLFWFVWFCGLSWPKKAFDTVDHKILIQNLGIYGISLTALNLFRSYMTNRTQICFING